MIILLSKFKILAKVENEHLTVNNHTHCHPKERGISTRNSSGKVINLYRATCGDPSFLGIDKNANTFFSGTTINGDLYIAFIKFQRNEMFVATDFNPLLIKVLFSLSSGGTTYILAQLINQLIMNYKPKSSKSQMLHLN